MKSYLKTFLISGIVIMVLIGTAMFVLVKPFAAQATSNVHQQTAKSTPISSPYADGQKATPTHIAIAQPTKVVQSTKTTIKAVQPTPTPAPVTPTVSWNDAPKTEYTTSATNVRSTPYTNGAIVATLEANATVTVYGTINGETVSTSPTWYRVSDQNSAPQYIYSGLLTTDKPAPAPSVNVGGAMPIVPQPQGTQLM
ncbi:SH3 domain-containing protein [Dictyobacter kobayashii]|uniref:SH3b domain-containing protein n=1 Tax=Dictyobacter kobayashii TaxID=2014872 RepID=A0A402AY00_9CHLR|nr:SH3 domain-containing protein [Dictyobacter kobayashii]GCE23934.1 hypothetical protein KDK_77340 [Dictyobacter kobayashii]